MLSTFVSSQFILPIRGWGTVTSVREQMKSSDSMKLAACGCDYRLNRHRGLHFTLSGDSALSSAERWKKKD
jgi:hypothetical protein